MDVRRRQLVGYLTAGIVVLALAAGFGGGYAAGFGSVTGGNRDVPARPLPEDVCTLVSREALARLVPSATKPVHERRHRSTRRVASTCEVVTDRRQALTYNEAELTVRVERFGADGTTSRTEAANEAMARARDEAGGSGRKVRGLGDRSWVTVDKVGPGRWNARVHAQYGDTLVVVDYATWLAKGPDTRSAAVATAREVLAGLS